MPGLPCRGLAWLGAARHGRTTGTAPPPRLQYVQGKPRRDAAGRGEIRPSAVWPGEPGSAEARTGKTRHWQVKTRYDMAMGTTPQTTSKTWDRRDAASHAKPRLFVARPGVA